MVGVAATYRATHLGGTSPDATHGFPAIEFRLSWVFSRYDRLNQARSRMPKPSRYSGVVESRIPQIARRLRSRMNDLGLNQTQDIHQSLRYL